MTFADSLDVLQSSQTFVRALKSAVDPPREKGPSKIQIARQGWDSQALYIPRKADLLLEWILTRFHREKFKKSSENPLIDAVHWTLLADILAYPGGTNIVSLITRISIPGLVSSFLTLCPVIPDSSKNSLFPAVLRSLDVLWPLAVQRAGIDPLSECFWTSLSVFSQTSDTLEWDTPFEVLSLVVTAFRFAFSNANAAGKKKAHVALVHNQLHSWLCALRFLPSTHSLHAQLYSLGTEVIFNPDSLRTSLETSFDSNTSTNIFSALFGPSIKSSQDNHMTFIDLLPRLTKSYFAVLHKHRPTICGTQLVQQGRDQYRRAAECFGSACLEFLEATGVDLGTVTPVWAAKVQILAVLEEETVFNFAENNIFVDNVREVGREATEILDKGWDGPHFHLVTHALDALACLHRMEPDILTPFIPQILERLATCSATASDSSSGLLSHLISYHSKTRTLHTLISLLLAAVAPSASLLPHADAHAVYGIMTRSPILSLSFTEELAASLRGFMTSGQADAILAAVHAALESSTSSLDAPWHPAPKRPKKSFGDDVSHHKDPHEIVGLNVVKFALIAQLSAPILTAVLHNSARGNAAERRKASLYRIDTLISGALEMSYKTEQGGTGNGSNKSKGKRAQREEYFDRRWYLECFSAALLRLWYDLFARSGSPGLETEENTWNTSEILDRLHNELLDHLRDGHAQTELQLEIGRVLFSRCASTRQEESSFQENGWPALDVILDYMEQNLFTDQDVTPSTEENLAIFIRKETALALWTMALDRHLFAIDIYASPKQLERLASLILDTRLNPHDRISASSVLIRVLASADFWESNNLRLSILMVLDKQTSTFSTIDIQRWLSAVVYRDSKAIKALLKANHKPMAYIERVVEIYRVLHYFPPEYLTRSSGLELAKRALAVDVFVRALSHQEEPKAPLFAEWQAILRSFVLMTKTQTQVRTFDEIAPIQEWMPYLILSEHAFVASNQTLTSSTLGLLSLIYMSGMRAASSREGKDNLLREILTHFIGSNPFISNCERFAQQSLLGMLSMLVREFKISSFSADILNLFRSLCLKLDDSLMPAIGSTASQTVILDFLRDGCVIEAWQVLLSFKQWLSIKLEAAWFGDMILKSTARTIDSTDGPDVPEEFRALVLSLVVQQGKMIPEAECRQISMVAAAYVLFTKSTPANSPLCDRFAVQAIKSSSVIQFEALLDLVAEAMGNHSNQWTESALISLLHLSKLLLREAPERTSKVSHKHAARCLRAFANETVFTKGSTALSMQVLGFLHLLCIERAASLKMSDTACIWTILSCLLIGSREHNDRTSASIFQTIAAIVDSLIRLRRDLIGPHLPQLSMILRQLIAVIRGVRPLLGTKQHHLVSDMLPKWVNPLQPLGEDEAQTLARVLTSLTTKSLVRSHSSNDNQKAESLARPFARHAPYVLLAYIQIMDDPLSVLPMTMRRKLEPGLFALCSVMGEHGRDTLMVQSLAVGGKELLKSLWKEYEKQKYIGGG